MLKENSIGHFIWYCVIGLIIIIIIAREHNVAAAHKTLRTDPLSV